MKSTRWVEIIGALALLGTGIIFLLQNLTGYVFFLSPYLWAGLFLAGGALFLLGFATDRSHWWPLIPGTSLVGVGLAIALGATFEGLKLVGGELSGAALFVSVAAGFVGVYLYDRRQNWWSLIPAAATGLLAVIVLISAISGELGGVVLFLGLGLLFAALYFVEIGGQRHNWWTLIPAGALFSLAVVVILSMAGAEAAAGAALFLGLGLTFGVLYLLRGPERPLEWAWIPAVALLAFGGFVLFLEGDTLFARLFWPLALVVAGLVLFVTNLRRQRG